MHEPLSARTLLRQSTADAHGRVDALFGAGFAGPASYAAYLEGMRDFLGAAADALPDLAPALARLDGDLAVVGVTDGHRGAAVAIPAEARLGWRYVIDGSSLGARVLLRQALAMGHDGERGARFLAGHAAATGWPETLAELAALPADPRRHHDLCAGADAAFATAHDALRRALARHRSPLPA